VNYNYQEYQIKTLKCETPLNRLSRPRSYTLCLHYKYQSVSQSVSAAYPETYAKRISSVGKILNCLMLRQVAHTASKVLQTVNSKVSETVKRKPFVSNEYLYHTNSKSGLSV
jgi:hypothetical protein